MCTTQNILSFSPQRTFSGGQVSEPGQAGESEPGGRQGCTGKHQHENQLQHPSNIVSKPEGKNRKHKKAGGERETWILSHSSKVTEQDTHKKKTTEEANYRRAQVKLFHRCYFQHLRQRPGAREKSSPSKTSLLEITQNKSSQSNIFHSFWRSSPHNLLSSGIRHTLVPLTWRQQYIAISLGHVIHHLSSQ